jgi:O-antigen ligase
MLRRWGSSGIPNPGHVDDYPSQTAGVELRPGPRDKPADLYRRWTTLCGPLGVSVYLAGFALPLPWDLPLMLLVVMSLPAILLSNRPGSSPWPPLSLGVLGFVATTGLATLGSADLGRSLHIGAGLLPAILLFFLIAEHFPDLRATRLLYLTFCVVVLGLAVALLWGVWKAGGRPPSVSTVLAVHSPILLVPNDSTFLAVLAPMVLVMLYQRPRSLGGVLAALALLLSGGVIVLLRSRTALLTLIISLTCAVALLRPRRRLAFALACALTLPVLALLIDGCLGFPLMTKFVRQWHGSGRLPLWRAAWAMFLDAPWLGHGPHTYVQLYRSYLYEMGLPSPSRISPWAHNLYLEVLAERGIVGFLALESLLVYALIAAWRTQRRAVGEAQRLGAGAIAGLIGFCSAAVVELTFLRQWVVVVLFILLGVIAHLIASQSMRQKEES